jgi:hypothetical protein
MKYRERIEMEPKAIEDGSAELMSLYNKGYMAEHPGMLSSMPRTEAALRKPTIKDGDVWGY